jgi:hypothetical protein
MNINIILDLYKLPQTVFSMRELALMFSSIAYPLLKRRLSYSVSTGKLIKLRRGIYAKPTFQPDELIQKIYTPSYISLQTVLMREGIIFQPYTTLFAVSTITREISVNNTIRISYHKMPSEILLCKKGLIEINNYLIASKERAFLDMIYIHKNYHIDNLTSINWDLIAEIRTLYKNKSFQKRVDSYYTLYKDEK